MVHTGRQQRIAELSLVTVTKSSDANLDNLRTIQSVHDLNRLPPRLPGFDSSEVTIGSYRYEKDDDNDSGESQASQRVQAVDLSKSPREKNGMTVIRLVLTHRTGGVITPRTHDT